MTRRLHRRHHAIGTDRDDAIDLLEWSDARAELQQAMDDYQRREKVLDRLMLLAQEGNDPALNKRIEGMYDRAWNVYLRKAGKLPATASARAKTEAALPGRGENP